MQYVAYILFISFILFDRFWNSESMAKEEFYCIKLVFNGACDKKRFDFDFDILQYMCITSGRHIWA